MRHMREVLRLTTAGVSGNEIGRRLNLGAVDGPLDAAAAGQGGARLAAAGGDERRRTRGPALRRGRHQAGSSPPCRARLGRTAS
jgi:hypothetical protein